ncbi:MAG: PAS domain S-box protein [Burkholderiales bacterium]|nr:PAS domain S-box protein [Burkholderiales bacterium]
MNLRSVLLVFGALLVGINVLSAIWDIRSERRVVERNALRDFNNLTALLADQTARSLEGTDLLLTAVANNINSSGLGDPAARAQRLADRISGIPQIRAIVLLDRDGRVIASTDQRSEIGADFSERSYFTHQRDATTKGRYVSEPFLGRITSRWAFAVSEPYTDAAGRFAGVVAAIMDVEYFNRLYRTLDMGEKGFVALLTQDGVLVARVPGRQEDFGKQLPDPRGVRDVIRREGRFSGWNQSVLTDPPTEVLISAMRVPDTPLVVAVGAPEHTVLAPWRTEAARVIARTVITSVVMLALMALAARELARRAEADMRAREGERRYAHAVAGANDGIWEYDVPNGRMYYSARALQLLGLDPKLEGFRGRDEWEALISFHEEDRQARAKAIDEHLAGEDLYYQKEWRVRQPDGSYRWVMVRGLGVREADGRPVRYAGSITDIEPSKRYEAAILRQTALLDELFESAPEAVALLGMDGRVIRTNREFASLFGFSAEESTGRALTELIVPADQLGDALADYEAVGSGQRVMVECERVRKDGVRLHVALTASPVAIAGEAIGTYTIHRDITERKLAESEQERLQSRLRQAEKMEAVGRLAGGIAHDFNNILGGILGYGEMLAESAGEGSPEQRYSRNLLIAANRARDLVDQILTYSRSQRAPRGPVEIGRIVAETLEVIRGSIPAEIVVDVHVPQTPLVVYGDPTQLHQVVMNLCTNAVHAMGGKGTLAVSLQAIDLESELKLAQATLSPGTYVKFTVSDTGTGMDQATLARIFEPFFTTKEVGRGTGLGLSLVYGIVADSGGATHVTSELGRGSTFEIYLPRTDAANLAVEREHGPIERGHGERILLIDDEKPLLIMTAELVTRLGYEPVPFSDPHSALASLQAMPEAYDLVLTDEMMPGLTGTALSRAARQARAGLPIILISGYTGPMLTQMALAAGVREVLRKPVQSRELAAALARALAP